MNQITVNGRTYTGNSVSVVNGVVYVDGKRQDDKPDVPQATGKVALKVVPLALPATSVTSGGNQSVNVIIDPAFKEDSVTILADEAMLPHIKINEGTVFFLIEGNWHCAPPKFEVRLRSPVESLGAQGSSTLTCAKAGALRSLNVGGASFLDVYGIESLHHATANGSSSLNFSGEADAPTLVVAGSSDLRGEIFEATQVSIQASGSSEVSLRTSWTTRVEVASSGSSEVDVKGAHQVSVTASGASEVAVPKDCQLAQRLSGAAEVRKQ